MAFSFQYYVGQIKQLKLKNHENKPIYNQFLPSGSHNQTTNKLHLDLNMAEEYADNHILGRSHVAKLNELVNPLYSFKLIDNTTLTATLEDKTQLIVTLEGNELRVKVFNSSNNDFIL